MSFWNFFAERERRQWDARRRVPILNADGGPVTAAPPSRNPGEPGPPGRRRGQAPRLSLQNSTLDNLFLIQVTNLPSAPLNETVVSSVDSPHSAP